MSGYCAILFRSPGHSLWAARALKKAGIERWMIPIPDALSPDCGYCIRIAAADAGRAEEALARAGIEYTRIAEIEGPSVQTA